MSGIADSILRSQNDIDSLRNSLTSYFAQEQNRRDEQNYRQQYAKYQQGLPTTVGVINPNNPDQILPSRPVTNASSLPNQSINFNPSDAAVDSGTATPAPIAPGKNVPPMLSATPPASVAPPTPESIANNAVAGTIAPAQTVPVDNSPKIPVNTPMAPPSQGVEQKQVYNNPLSVEATLQMMAEKDPTMLQNPYFKEALANAQTLKALNTEAIQGAPVWIADPSDSTKELAYNKHANGTFSPAMSATGTQLSRLKSAAQPKHDTAWWKSQITSATTPDAKQKALDGYNESLKLDMQEFQQKQDIMGARQQYNLWNRPITKAFTDNDGHVHISVITPNQDPSQTSVTTFDAGKLGKTAGVFKEHTDNLGRVDALYNPKTNEYITAASLGLDYFKDAQLPTTYKNAVAAIPAVSSMIGRAEALIKKLPDNLGPINGRLSDFYYKKIGSDNPEYTGLRTTLEYIASKMMQVHTGSRGSNLMLETFTNMLNSNNASVGNMIASLEATKAYLNDIKSEGAQYDTNTPENVNGNTPATTPTNTNKKPKLF